MIELTGSIKTFPRGYLPDGVSVDRGIYDLSNAELKKGRRQIKGVLGAVLNDKQFIPYGQNGFFYSLLDKNPELGVKVYYSIQRRKAHHKLIQGRIWRNYVSCYEAGISPEPISVTDVQLDLLVDNRKVKLSCFGLIIQKACYPESALEQLARGQFYDFDCLDKEVYTNHSPQAFKRFRRKASKIITQLGISMAGVKLGDIIYCMRNKRWYLVDCG